MAGTESQSLGTAFHGELSKTLRRRSSGDLQFLVALHEEPVMFRPFMLPEDERELAGFPLRELYFSSIAGFSRIVPFSQVLSRAFHGMPGFSGESGWRYITAWFAAVEACRYVRRLLDQLDVPDDGALRLGYLPGDFRTRFTACLNDARGVRSLAREFADRCVQKLRTRLGTSEDKMKPAFVKLVPKRRSVSVEWLADDSDGTVLCRETLRQFVSAMTGGADWAGLTAELARIARSQQHHAEVGTSILQAVSPRVAHATKIACTEGRSVGVRLGTTRVRRTIPLSVWLFVDPSPERGELAEVTITANRAHEEFVLQAGPPHDDLWYFPSSVLVAKLGVKNGELSNDHFPAVRVPKGGAPWLHPYTGGLRKTTFTEAILLDEEEPAYLPPSPNAGILWPSINDRAGRTLENDICLTGQKRTVDMHFKQFNRQAKRGQPDVLALVNAIHEVVRVGLTRAHCKNQAAPRTSMRDTLFPLGGKKPPPWLAHRVFSYNLDRPVNA